MLCTTCTLVSMRKPLVLLICAVAAGIAVAVGVCADAVYADALCVVAVCADAVYAEAAYICC